MKLSIIIPVYNRPDEVEELLSSLSGQCLNALAQDSARHASSAARDGVTPAHEGPCVRDFEVIIVEDGSSVPCKDVVRRWAGGQNDTHSAARKNTTSDTSAKVIGGDTLLQSVEVREGDQSAKPGDCATPRQNLAEQDNDRPTHQYSGSHDDSLQHRSPVEFLESDSHTGTTLPHHDRIAPQPTSALDIRYYFKPNSGPGPARNYGAERARGEYLIFLDSDVIVPPGWLAAVIDALPADAFGGPDRAAATFTPLQKAIDYAMTSPLTTGGIRGRRKSVDRFFPRSFNMGVRREVFEAVGGFAAMRFGEDIDLSYRIVEAGFATRLVPDAWVWHKRRVRMRQFFKQVFNSGAARVSLGRLHPGSLRLVHLLPTAFVAGCAAVVVAAFRWPWILSAFAIFVIAIFIDAAMRTGSLRVGALAVAASAVQLTGYGTGFIYGLIGGRGAFEKNFYR